VRSLADQTVEELGGATSILVRQKRDHERLDRLLAGLETASGREQDRILAEVFRLVFSHAFAEESVLWPALRDILPDGEGLTRQVEREHQEVNELVTRVERTDPSDPERERLLTRMSEVLRQDVRDEEDELLPRLQAAVDVRRLRALGWQWWLVRRVAPTHAHPEVSRRPPGNVAAALPLTVLDRTRDVVDAAARRSPPRVSPLLRSTSRGLRHASHTVGNSSLFKSG